MAAVPQQPGFSLATIYYHASVHAGADVGRAREITTGRIPVSANVNIGASLKANADFALLNPTYVFENSFLGGQAAVGLLGLYGGVNTSLAAALSGTLGTPLGTIPFSRTDTSVTQ